MAEYELAVDFMDMTDDRRLWTCLSDGAAGFEPVVGGYVVVGDDEAERTVARVLTVDAEGNIELEILPGSVESNRDQLSPTY